MCYFYQLFLDIWQSFSIVYFETFERKIISIKTFTLTIQLWRGIIASTDWQVITPCILSLSSSVFNKLQSDPPNSWPLSTRYVFESSRRLKNKQNCFLQRPTSISDYSAPLFSSYTSFVSHIKRRGMLRPVSHSLSVRHIIRTNTSLALSCHRERVREDSGLVKCAPPYTKTILYINQSALILWQGCDRLSYNV